MASSIPGENVGGTLLSVRGAWRFARLMRKLLAVVPVADPGGCPAAPADTAQVLNNPVRDLGHEPPLRRSETAAADHILRVD